MKKIDLRPSDADADPTMIEELLLRGLQPKDVVVMVIDMLMAGIDTTSHTTAFLLYYLARNPRVQERLRQAIDLFENHQQLRARTTKGAQAPWFHR